MKMSSKRRYELYKAIREPIVDMRIKLRLAAKDDAILATVEDTIWQRQKRVLGLK